MERSLLYPKGSVHWQEYRDRYPNDSSIQTVRSPDLSNVPGAIALNKQKYTFIKNTISVVADDLGEAGYRHSGSSKSEPVRGGYVMPPEASSIDTLLSRSKALADQMREEADD